jgi:hypothetical protein
MHPPSTAIYEKPDSANATFYQYAEHGIRNAVASVRIILKTLPARIKQLNADPSPILFFPATNKSGRVFRS